MSERQGTYLGFDYGVKKIGVAVGDASTAMAHALETVPALRQATNWPAIESLIQTWKPVALVVGLSIDHDGSDNPVTPRMRKFCRQLEGRFRLPVHTMDEILTTYEAKQMLFEEAGVSADTLWAVQDQVAAQLILQTWLNHTQQKDQL